jgi:hypothetical protein
VRWLGRLLRLVIRSLGKRTRDEQIELADNVMSTDRVLFESSRRCDDRAMPAQGDSMRQGREPLRAADWAGAQERVSRRLPDRGRMDGPRRARG